MAPRTAIYPARLGQSLQILHIDVILAVNKVKALGGRERERLRVATWNFSGLGSECKQKEIGELNSIDVVAGQESGKGRILKSR